MTKAELALARVEAVVDDIERLERALGFPVRQPTDREAFDIVLRIERKMLAVTKLERQLQQNA